MLEDNGYEIRILNTINFKKSMKYNPFSYIHSEKDILKLVQTIIANTKGEGEKAGEDFWVKAEKLYYTALIAYIYYEAPKEEKNFATLLDMIDASEVREDDENYKNPIDRLFEALEKKEPRHFAVKQYKKYKLAAGKTAKSILISCGARLAPFDIQELIDLYNISETKSNQNSFAMNYQKTGKNLMSQDEITAMDGGKCIFQLRGVRPFFSDKYDITKHKNYSLLEDYDKKNRFDVENYINRRGEARLNREISVIRL